MSTALAERGNNELTNVSEIITDAEAPSVIATLNKSEIDTQIATARRFPRSIKAFKQQALELATLDEHTAASMFYVLPRDGKTIEGPSSRMAEVVGSCWGNLRYSARVIDIDESWVTAQGMCFDLEKNVAAAVEVRRRITNKYGKRYSDDMIGVTANAACSIALRNAIFKIVPRALWSSIYEMVKETSIGKAETMQARRDKVIGYFAKMGIDSKRLLSSVGRAGVDDLTTDDIIHLRGIATAIKEGDTSIDEVFPLNKPQSGGASAAIAATKERLATPAVDQKPAEAVNKDGEVRPIASTDPHELSDAERAEIARKENAEWEAAQKKGGAK